MIHNIALALIFGKPVIMYGGIATLLSLLFTATVGFLNYNGMAVIPFKWHPRLAALTIIMALMHGLLGLSIFFNF